MFNSNLKLLNYWENYSNLATSNVQLRLYFGMFREGGHPDTNKD